MDSCIPSLRKGFCCSGVYLYMYFFSKLPRGMHCIWKNWSQRPWFPLLSVSVPTRPSLFLFFWIRTTPAVTMDFGNGSSWRWFSSIIWGSFVLYVDSWSQLWDPREQYRNLHFFLTAPVWFLHMINLGKHRLHGFIHLFSECNVILVILLLEEVTRSPHICTKPLALCSLLSWRLWY